MKRKRFLSGIITCGLSCCILLTATTEAVWAATQNVDSAALEATDFTANAANTVTVIAYGDDADLHWSINSYGELYISGTGNADAKPWMAYQNQIKSAYISMTSFTSMKEFFKGCTALTYADFSGSDFSDCMDMSQMFYGCKNLLDINLQTDADNHTIVNTGNVTNMESLFNGCSSLQSVHLNDFNTSNVTSMARMFESCSQLEYIDLSSFDVGKVTTMAQMFENCSVLAELDLSNFRPVCTTDMSAMFFGCTLLGSINLTGFNTSSVIKMPSMFSGCKNLYEIDLSSFNTSNITDMSGMFADSNFGSLDLSNFDTRKVTSMSDMFAYCNNLTNINLSSFNTANVTDMTGMFSYISCNSLDLSSFDTSKVTKANHMFAGTPFETLNLSNFDFSQLKSAEHMFDGLTSLTRIQTPKHTPVSIVLPVTMYSETGKEYNSLPLNNNSSLTLTTTKPAPAPQTITYYVSFQGNHATSGRMNKQKITYGSNTLFTANAFKRTGYNFTGWSTTPDGKGTIYKDKADASTLTQLNGTTITLYAQWKPISYSIKYKLNGGTNTKKNPSKYSIGSSTITLKNPTRKGYTFKGWYTDSKYKKKITKINKGSTGSKTLYAKWTANKYTITFNANHKKVTGKTKALSCTYGKKHKLTANGFKCKGYKFTGWSTNKKGSGKKYKNKAEIKNLTTKANGKITLYAQWQKVK